MLTLAAAVLVVTARLSWFNPALCHELPVNCFDPDRWWNMAAGHDAREWYGRALACPGEFPLGSKWIIEGSRWGLADGEFECLDRGGRIVIDADGIVWLDLLTDKPIWGDVLPVIVLLERNQNEPAHKSILRR